MGPKLDVTTYPIEVMFYTSNGPGISQCSMMNLKVLNIKRMSLVKTNEKQK